MSYRLTAVDATRAIAMILMTLDHASSAFNAGRISGEGVGLARPGDVDALQFAVRWVTHFCAPAFFLLAGMGLALAGARRQRAGAPDRGFDRDLLIRGLLLIGLEVVWMSWAWRFELRAVHLEVLYALGASMIAMIAVRRLPPGGVLACALALLLGCELAADWLVPLVGRDHPVLAAAITGARYEHVTILYPVLPWLGLMALGYALGQWLAAGVLGTARQWLALAALAALVFLAARGLDGYGNFDFHRGGSSVIDWLRTSKYPPSLTFAAGELALIFLVLAAFTRWRARPELLVLGRTALCFYLLHIHLLKGAAFALGVHRACGLDVVFLAWVAALAILYPVCVLYDRAKQRHPRSLLRFL